MLWLSKLFAIPVFWIAYALFRSPVAARWRLGHQGVMRLFRFAAERGHKRALSVYGHLLLFRGEGQDSRIQGGIYLQRAADLGDMKAQYQVGCIFAQGYAPYFPVDPQQARHYWQLAAASGHPLAQSRLNRFSSD
ncbi:tetratricopeptide repeat protein [Nitrincola tapanii]|uniref:Sel1 repeat family protein n=1 Tax=Nitrincola tapanii TaxID=1708751 RepID=A0A5A9W0P4_9GAMM|nr:SEL1-like repeat protein [Nitrincola tapanii]KAA0874123.1 sel1 repeat family protein [Nitrincola tapanii]